MDRQLSECDVPRELREKVLTIRYFGRNMS